MNDWSILEANSGVTFAVRVKPRSSRNQVDGVESGALRIRLTAPPVKGAANTALIELIAEWLGVRRSAVSIVSGDKASRKLVRVNGVTRRDVETRLLRPSNPGGPSPSSW